MILVSPRETHRVEEWRVHKEECPCQPWCAMCCSRSVSFVLLIRSSTNLGISILLLYIFLLRQPADTRMLIHSLWGVGKYFEVPCLNLPLICLTLTSSFLILSTLLGMIMSGECILLSIGAGHESWVSAQPTKVLQRHRILSGVPHSFVGHGDNTLSASVLEICSDAAIFLKQIHPY